MSNRVNPPKQLVLPPEVAQNKQLKKAFDDRDFILFQIWKRIGAGDDIVAGSEDQTNILRATAISNAALFRRKQIDGTLNNRIEALEVRPKVSIAAISKQQQKTDLLDERLETVEIDLSTRPRISDIFKVNQRVNQLIDELITEIRAIAPNTELEHKAHCVQVETLQQLKLLNMRNEEILETDLDESDL